MRYIEYKPAYSLSINDRRMDFFPVDQIDPETGQAGFLYYFNHYLNGDPTVIHAYIGIDYFKYVNENGLMQESPVSACLLGATGEATGVSDLTVLMCDECVLVSCADSVFCLSLPDLNLNWKVKADVVTCLGLYQIGSNYLIHGAFEISMLDEEGNCLWNLSSKGISWDFYNGIEKLSLERDYFKVWDWDKRMFCFNFEGELVNGPEFINAEHFNVEPKKDSKSRIKLLSGARSKNQIVIFFVLALLISMMALVIKTYF
ncbi:MAG TPA: hypothetical protein VGF79_04685 [Bacteroidia bacterium]